jgi:hypothetical protein
VTSEHSGVPEVKRSPFETISLEDWEIWTEYLLAVFKKQGLFKK